MKRNGTPYITGGGTNIIVLQNHYYTSSGLDRANTLFRHAIEKAHIYNFAANRKHGCYY